MWDRLGHYRIKQALWQDEACIVYVVVLDQHWHTDVITTK